MNRFGKIAPAVTIFVCLLISIAAVSASDGKAYGAPLTGTDTIKISELFARPDDYVGQTVRVEGLINGVCEKRGCWMSLASALA